jgi:hypothetical protein
MGSVGTLRPAFQREWAEGAGESMAASRLGTSVATLTGRVNMLVDAIDESRAAVAATRAEAQAIAGARVDNNANRDGANGGVGIAEETAGSIRNVNPGYPTTGRTQNCVNCTVATDATLSGNPAAALPSSGPVSIRALEQQYGGRFGAPTTSSGIEQQLLSAGDGARGIVFGSRGPNEVGHVFNVVNQNGVVRFLDGQTGQPATFSGYQSFHLLRTNKP